MKGLSAWINETRYEPVEAWYVELYFHRRPDFPYPYLELILCKHYGVDFDTAGYAFRSYGRKFLFSFATIEIDPRAAPQYFSDYRNYNDDLRCRIFADEPILKFLDKIRDNKEHLTNFLKRNEQIQRNFGHKSIRLQSPNELETLLYT
jgi:hypothetical protein